MSGEPLRQAFVRGLAWTGGGRFFAQTIGWASTVVVARILVPEDYGIVGMAVVFLGFMTVLSEFGVGVTVVTLRDLAPSQIAQLNGLALALGVAGLAIVVAAAPAVAAVFGQPALTAVVAALAITVLCASVRTVPAAMLQRDLRFKTLAAIETTQAIVAAAVTFAAALAGWRYWSLVASVIVGGVVGAALTAWHRPTPMARPRRRSLGEALVFTRRQLTGSVAWFFYSNSDFAVAGRLLGAQQLGIYSMAWTFSRIVPERLASVLLRLTPAFFSALQNDTAAVRRWLYALTEIVSVACAPILIGLAMIADDAVPLVAGPQWSGAVAPLRLLAVYAVYDLLMQLISRALIATGQIRFTSRLGVALAIVMPPAFIVGARWGGVGIAAAWVVAAPLVRSALFVPARRHLGVDVRGYTAALAPAASGVLVMAVVVLIISAAVAGWPLFWRVAAKVAAGAVAYGGALLILNGRRVGVWRQEWRSVREGRSLKSEV